MTDDATQLNMLDDLLDLEWGESVVFSADHMSGFLKLQIRKDGAAGKHKFDRLYDHTLLKQHRHPVEVIAGDIRSMIAECRKADERG